MANATENRILRRQLQGFLEPVVDPLLPKWGGIPTVRTADPDRLPAIPAEFAHGASDEFRELLTRALRDGPDSLDPDDQRRLKAAMEQFPELAEAFRQQRGQQEQVRKTPEQTFAERTDKYFSEAMPGGFGPSDPYSVGKAAVKTMADFLSEAGSPLIQYLEDRKAQTPHPVSPSRDFNKEPLTIAEENYLRLSGPDKMLAWSDFVMSSATSSLLSFFTQSLDHIVNPEKHQTTTYKALDETALGLTDMIAQSPDQVSHIAEAIYGTRENPVSKLAELAGTILQAPKLVLDNKDREQLRVEAINSFYKNPEGLPFAVMIVKGVYNRSTRGLRKPFDRLVEEPKAKPTVAKTPELVAKEVGVKYDGLQELPKRRADGKIMRDAEGKIVMDHLYSFTDPKTGSSFTAKDLGEVGPKLKAMREKFELAKKPKVEKPAPAEPIREVSDLREGMTVFIRLPKHRQPKRAKITSLVTDEAGKPVRVQVRYPGKIKGKQASFETTLTPDQIQIPGATLKLREYHKALSYVPKKERAAVAQKARDFDALLRDNIERFLDEAKIEEVLAEQVGIGARAEALSIARVMDEARSGAEATLNLSDLKNPVKRAEALPKLQEWLKAQKVEPVELTVLGDLDLKKGDRVKMSGEWFRVEPSEKPGNIKLTDGRTLDIEDTFTKLPIEAVTRAGEERPLLVGEKGKITTKEEIIPPIEQRAVGFAIPKLSDKFTRELKRAQKERGEAPEIPSMVIERAPKDVGLTSAIRTPTNLFKAIPTEPTEAAYWYRDQPLKEPKYGRAAQQSSIDLALSERDIMIEVGQRGEFLDAILHEAKKDKKAWGKHGETFYNLVDGTVVDPSLSPKSLEAVETVRKVMTGIRNEVIQRRREQLRPAVTEIVNREWRAERGLKGKKLTDAQRTERAAAVETALKDRVPDDWGIENYLPQMHPGDWSVWAEIDGVKTFVGAARTPSQAITRAMDHYAKHPELTPEGYRVTGRAFRGWDVLRVTQAKLWRTMGEIAKQAEDALSPEQVRDALRGVIGAKERRQKFAGFLQERKGYEGYRKDIMGVLSVFNQNFTRWKHLTDLNKVIQARLREIRAEGRPNAANEIEAIFTHLWGRTPSKISKLFDASLQKVPGIRDYVRPMAYDRFLGRVKGGVVLTFLKINPRFNLLNRLQRYQTTLPVLKGLPHTAEWRTGTKFYNSAEGHAALDQFGIKHLTGGKFLEGGRTLTKPKTREKFRSFAPETSNQEIAWATMFERAKKFGFSDLAANDYAFLKGNVYTQFVHLSTDVPALIRGPTMSTIMQFKRFPIKNVELGIDLIAERNYPGVAKWIGAQILLGGAKIATSPVRVAGGASAAWITAKMYQKIKEEHGEIVADVIAWGLPALVGLDMSYSFQLVDTPWGKGVPEKIGNFFMGPSGNVVYSAARSAMSDKGLETSRFDRALKSVTQRVPGLKFIDALRTLAEGLDKGEYRFEDPAGRLKFKGDLRDVIVKGLGGRTLDEARIELLTEAATEINEQRDKVLNHIANTFIQKQEIDFQARCDWNELWPEFPIDEEAMMRRMIARLDTKDLDRYQRIMKTLPRVFRPAFYKYDEEKMQEVLK